ncbi:MAG: RluA family pseudouridine synthase [Synechococcales cyanobacterium M58_A2018_015]|nr:RluA family pseudouridine synthase [Synechococcales cyanobacterium M58_A2018_015]
MEQGVLAQETDRLQPLSAFVEAFVDSDSLLDAAVTDWYEGYCPQTQQLLRLPRTRAAEAVARGLMQQLARDDCFAREGKMYGVLLVVTHSGSLAVLKAFSGLLRGQRELPGWVPPIPGRERVALAEAQTLAALEAMKQELIELQQLPERQQYAVLAQDFAVRLQTLQRKHQQQRRDRQQQRQVISETLTGPARDMALEALNEQSRQEGIERRRLKQERDAVLLPLQQVIDQAGKRIQQVRQRRKALSRSLQQQLHAAYRLSNFAGESLALQAFRQGELPTGTGDCCAPKLLHYAATQGLTPIAMAEFWWGPPSPQGDKVAGKFYAACAERCQPLLGFLLSGLPPVVLPTNAPDELPILYEDTWLIAVDKPAGLLSVPGRRLNQQDSVVSRLRLRHPELAAVHRLDQDTSGILLLAKDPATHRQLSQQMQQRQIHKLYEAILAGAGIPEQGLIDLPLSADPTVHPRQRVDWQSGKPCQTQFRRLDRGNPFARIELIPLTGRTHQLRLHTAAGLGIPILGDRLYGCQTSAARLHLHARVLHIQHPQTGKLLELRTIPPF